MIYLLRHGETMWNTLGRFHGQKDSPLTKRGVAQADLMGSLLAREIAGREKQFKGYVSPLGRAKETAERIARVVPLTFTEEPRLTEFSVGSWDGMTFNEVGIEYPGALDGANSYDWYLRSPDGESFDQACKRIGTWLSEVMTPAVAISHGLTGRLLRGIYLGLSRRDMLELPVPQSGFYRLDGGRADFVNDSSPDNRESR